jgi:hypothetical protein
MDGSKTRSQNYSRTKGNVAEQLYAKRFREMGFEFCRTSREASDLLDSCGVDLWGIPINAQIKCGFKKQRPNAEALLRKIREDLKKRFPPADPVHKIPKVLIHKAQGYTPEGELVTMTWTDWMEMFTAWAIVNGHLDNKRITHDMLEGKAPDDVRSS